jgi:catechol-2,3-dioxygenase
VNGAVPVSAAARQPSAATPERTTHVEIATFVSVALLSASTASAQLVEPNQLGLRMGHVHLAVRDIDAQKQFWVGVMAGRS